MTFGMVLFHLALHQLPGEEISDPVAERSFFHASQILQSYDPRKYFVIALGSNAAPIASAIRTLIGDNKLLANYFIELPVENYHQMDTDPFKKRMALAKIIPSPLVLNGREVVLVRILGTGKVMENFSVDVSSHLRHRPFGQTDRGSILLEPDEVRSDQKINGYFIAHPKFEPKLAKLKPDIERRLLGAVSI